MLLLCFVCDFIIYLSEFSPLLPRRWCESVRDVSRFLFEDFRVFARAFSLIGVVVIIVWLKHWALPSNAELLQHFSSHHEDPGNWVESISSLVDLNNILLRHVNTLNWHCRWEGTLNTTQKMLSRALDSSDTQLRGKERAASKKTFTVFVLDLAERGG